MSVLVDHARRELELISETPEIIDVYLKVIQSFDELGMSGLSASVAIPTIMELLSLKNLSPLTDSPDEWAHHVENVWGGEGGIWQNRRNGEAFSMDGGKTYYLISDRTKNMNFFKAPNESAKMEVEEEMVAEENELPQPQPEVVETDTPLVELVEVEVKE